MKGNFLAFAKAKLAEMDQNFSDFESFLFSYDDGLAAFKASLPEELQFVENASAEQEAQEVTELDQCACHGERRRR